jgi:hypothetical protein
MVEAAWKYSSALYAHCSVVSESQKAMPSFSSPWRSLMASTLA